MNKKEHEMEPMLDFSTGSEARFGCNREDGDYHWEDKLLAKEAEETDMDSRQLKNLISNIDSASTSSQSFVLFSDILRLFTMFRYATGLELCATCFGILMGMATAWALSLAIVIYGEFTNLMVERIQPGANLSSTTIIKVFGGGRHIVNASADQNADLLAEDSTAYGLGSLAITSCQFIAGVLSIHALNWSADRQIARIRLLFLKSVLRQDMSWYDTQPNLNFASKITDDINKLKDGMGEKIGMFCYLMFSFFFTMAVSFIYGWKLTLVVVTSIPVIIISAVLVAKAQSSLTVKELNSYSHAGSVAEEVLSAIRTVIAFGGEQKEIQRFSERLAPANKAAVQRGLVTGLGDGIVWLVMFCSFALVFWYGIKLIQAEEHLPLEERDYTLGILIVVLFSVTGAAQNLGLCSPHTEAFAAARGAAQSVFEIIACQPAIDSMSEEGEKPEKVSGDIRLTDVYFKYPSRPDVMVLSGLSLDIKAGETVALVGGSGCGKSTVLQLLQRMYDPLSGKVEFDGKRLPELNVTWLRSHMGVVGQEPVLFSGSIRDNIEQGKPGCTDEEIFNAAIAANCHDFINKLPFGYNTMIGERGAQLSGGQKQRIAIARSLVRDPRVLLLDEATSALDAQGERKVQDALDRASHGRTTVMVTHRLATVTNASRIFYIDHGRVAEQGSHEELLALQGYYWRLVQTDLQQQQSRDPPVPVVGDGDIPVDTLHSHLEKAQTMSVSTPEQIRKLSRDSLQRLHKRTSISSVHNFSRTQMTLSAGDKDMPEGVDIEEVETKALEKSVSNWALLTLNKPEWVFILFGCLSSLVVGGILPAYALLFSEVYGLLSLADHDEIASGTAFYCGLFVLVGVLCGCGTFLQSYLFSEAGVRLTQRLRVRTFANLLHQEMAWYDDPKNSVGALCARLSGDAAAVQGATGLRIGTILQAISSLIIGVLMAAVYSWKMTLVSLITVPIVLGGIWLEGKVIGNSQIKERKAMEGASKIATEAIMNIRTVHSLGAEKQFLERYEKELQIASQAGDIKSRMRGAVYSLGLVAPSLGYGISLYYGGLLVAYEGLPYKNAILVSEALIFGSWTMGQVLAFTPNFNAAKVSGARILRLMKRKPLIHNDKSIPDDGSWRADGSIEYSDVEFNYPSRPEVCVLRGLELDVRAGQTVALVGHSGCGKSTAIQLLQRLYQPCRGQISLDTKDISTMLQIPRLRAQLGLVSQEPTLFDRTIGENIAYGDNTRKVPTNEIIDAAIKTNIHSFISGLPLGYDTPLGTKGAQLSGGQKQRIAIARALVRNPRVLLLDEATSALDTQSEKLVQQALDVAKEGRTCITIAHRLSTIQNADLIYVIDKGRIIEKGKHQELLAKKGLYAELYSMQALATDSGISKLNGKVDSKLSPK